MASARFAGFSRHTFGFFQDLAAHNNRGWFAENRDRYEAHVLDPACRFVGTLGPRLARKCPRVRYDAGASGAGSIVRIDRDTRFSKDKSPFKTNLGILFWYEGRDNRKENPGFYFHLDAEGAWLYAGLHSMTRDQLPPFRKQVADDPTGAELARILARLRRGGADSGGCHYKRVPAPYPADHPRADLLRHNALWVRFGPVPRRTVQSAALVGECQKVFGRCARLNDWLADALA